MPTLAEAEATLAAAQAAHDKARLASQKATDDAAALRAKLKAGGPGSAKITAADIARADQAAEFAALTYQGASAEIPALATAVKDARANQACDETLADLALVDQEFAPVREAIEAALPALVAWVERRDAVVEAAIHRLEKVALNPEPAYEAGSGTTTYRRGERRHRPSSPERRRPRRRPNPRPLSLPASSSRATMSRLLTESL